MDRRNLISRAVKLIPALLLLPVFSGKTTLAQGGRKKRKPLEQDFQLVTDIQPAYLSDEIKKPNQKGYHVSIDHLMVVHDRFAIFIDGAQEDYEEEEETGGMEQ